MQKQEDTKFLETPSSKKKEKKKKEAFVEFSFESTKQALQYLVSDTGERKVKN